jgi:hypothetical protein
MRFQNRPHLRGEYGRSMHNWSRGWLSLRSGTHELDESTPRNADIGVERPPYSVEIEERGVRASSRCGAIAAPLPLARIGHDACFHRIEDDISEHLQEVLILVNQQRFEPTLKHVSDAVMPAVERLTVGGVQLLHHPRDGAIAGLEQQMEMVPHKAIGTTEDGASAHRFRQHVEKSLIVIGIEKDRLLGVAA